MFCLLLSSVSYWQSWLVMNSQLEVEKLFPFWIWKCAKNWVPIKKLEPPNPVATLYGIREQERMKEWMNKWIILIFRVLSYSKRHYFAILTRLIHPWGLLGPNKEKEMQNSKENSLDKHYVVEQRKLNYFLSFLSN